MKEVISVRNSHKVFNPFTWAFALSLIQNILNHSPYVIRTIFWIKSEKDLKEGVHFLLLFISFLFAVGMFDVLMTKGGF